jgi:hypothetical protein
MRKTNHLCDWLFFSVQGQSGWISLQIGDGLPRGIGPILWNMSKLVFGQHFSLCQLSFWPDRCGGCVVGYRKIMELKDFSFVL